MCEEKPLNALCVECADVCECECVCAPGCVCACVPVWSVCVMLSCFLGPFSSEQCFSTYFSLSPP